MVPEGCCYPLALLHCPPFGLPSTTTFPVFRAEGGDGWAGAWRRPVVLGPGHLAPPERHLGELWHDPGRQRGRDPARRLCQVRRPLVPDPLGSGGDGCEAARGEIPLQASRGEAGTSRQSPARPGGEPGAGEGVQHIWPRSHRLRDFSQRYGDDRYPGGFRHSSYNACFLSFFM